MENIYNRHLLELYKSGIKNLPSMSNLDVEPAYPLILSVPDDWNNKVKVMFFGQETNGWLNLDYQNLNSIEEAMNRYKRFWIDKKSKYSNSGTFMQVLNKFQNMLDTNRVSCIWNNIIKIGKKDKKGTPTKSLIEWQQNWFEIIKKEVELLKPDFLIFFTGPNYDKYIKRTFGEFTKSEVINRNTREIAKLTFKENDKLIAIRTYHPSYLRRQKLENEILLLLKDTILNK